MSKIKKNKERWGRESDEGQTDSSRLQSLAAVMLEEVSYKTELWSLSLPHTS